jgi:hypothetical protein
MFIASLSDAFFITAFESFIFGIYLFLQNIVSTYPFFSQKSIVFSKKCKTLGYFS